MTNDIPPFVRFVLHHMQVKTNVCSYQCPEDGYRLEPRTVPDHNLIFVTRGQVVWAIDDEEHNLNPGDLLIVPPHRRHHARSRTRVVTLLSIHVEANLPGAGVRAGAGAGGREVFELLNPPPTRPVDRGGRLDQYLRGAEAEWQRSDPILTRRMLAHWARLIVPELLLEDAHHGRLHPRPIDPVVAGMLEELPRHIDLPRPTDLTTLARQSGYTPQHLNRLFRRSLGLTPLQYLARLRMERAASLLAEGRLSVAGIARRVGLEDPYYFSRLFKQHFGRSPSEYRQAAGSNSPSGDSDPPLPAGGQVR